MDGLLRDAEKVSSLAYGVPAMLPGTPVAKQGPFITSHESRAA
jgi:hypothetical protein